MPANLSTIQHIVLNVTELETRLASRGAVVTRLALFLSCLSAILGLSAGGFAHFHVELPISIPALGTAWPFVQFFVLVGAILSWGLLFQLRLFHLLVRDALQGHESAMFRTRDPQRLEKGLY